MLLKMLYKLSNDQLARIKSKHDLFIIIDEFKKRPNTRGILNEVEFMMRKIKCLAVDGLLVHTYFLRWWMVMLIRFLNMNGFTESFVDQIKISKNCKTIEEYFKYLHEHFDSDSLPNPIHRACWWSESLNGFDYWSDVNDKWYGYLEDEINNEFEHYAKKINI